MWELAVVVINLNFDQLITGHILFTYCSFHCFLSSKLNRIFSFNGQCIFTNDLPQIKSYIYIYTYSVASTHTFYINGKLLTKKLIPCVETCVEASCISWSPTSSTSCDPPLCNVTLLGRVCRFAFLLAISTVKV